MPRPARSLCQEDDDTELKEPTECLAACTSLDEVLLFTGCSNGVVRVLWNKHTDLGVIGDFPTVGAPTAIAAGSSIEEIFPDESQQEVEAAHEKALAAWEVRKKAFFEQWRKEQAEKKKAAGRFQRPGATVRRPKGEPKPPPPDARPRPRFLRLDVEQDDNPEATGEAGGAEGAKEDADAVVAQEKPLVAHREVDPGESCVVVVGDITGAVYVLRVMSAAGLAWTDLHRRNAGMGSLEDEFNANAEASAAERAAQLAEETRRKALTEVPPNAVVDTSLGGRLATYVELRALDLEEELDSVFATNLLERLGIRMERLGQTTVTAEESAIMLEACGQFSDKAAPFPPPLRSEADAAPDDASQRTAESRRLSGDELAETLGVSTAKQVQENVFKAKRQSSRAKLTTDKKEADEAAKAAEAAAKGGEEAKTREKSQAELDYEARVKEHEVNVVVGKVSRRCVVVSAAVSHGTCRSHSSSRRRQPRLLCWAASAR